MVGTYLVKKKWMRCIRCSCVCKWAVTWCAMKVCKVGNVRVRILGTYVLHEWRWERQWQVCSLLSCKSRRTQTLTWQSFELWPLGLQSSSQANQPRRPPMTAITQNAQIDTLSPVCWSRLQTPDWSRRPLHTLLSEHHAIQNCTPLLQQYKAACMSYDSVTSSAPSDCAQ